MSIDVLKVVREMSVFDQGILVVLVVMALCSVIVFLERLLAFRKGVSSNRAFARVASELLARGSYQALAERGANAKDSSLGQLLASGMQTFLRHSEMPPSKLSPIEATRRELLRRTEALAADIRRGLSLLASVGSVAPFVGLLGTVMGIIHSFQSIAKEGTGGLGTVSAGISEALLVTAAGLVVAIPAVLAFNFLTTRSERILLALDQARGEFLDHLEHTVGTGWDAR